MGTSYLTHEEQQEHFSSFSDDKLEREYLRLYSFVSNDNLAFFLNDFCQLAKAVMMVK